MDPGAELDREVAAFQLQHRALRVRPVAAACAVCGFIGFVITLGVGSPFVTAVAALVAGLLCVVAGLTIALSRTPLFTNGLISLVEVSEGPGAESTSMVRLLCAVAEGLSWAGGGVAVAWYGVRNLLGI